MEELKVKKEKVRKVFLDDLPRWESGANKGKINWIRSIGYLVRFIYDDIEGFVKIVGYDGKYLYIKYLDNESFEIFTGHFKKCNIGKLLGKYTGEFKIEIGQTFKDDKRDMTIIDIEYRDKIKSNGRIEKQKWYKYKCNKCGYNEGWIEESNLITNMRGCPVCCSNHQVVVSHINSIVANPETHWMIPYFQGGYDEAERYSCQSHETIYPICPDCGRIRFKKIKISEIYNSKSIGCPCNDKITYPEKFMFNVLEQLGLNFKKEKIFNWSRNIQHDKLILNGKKKYDFYFKYNNESYIVETHGGQHYEDQRRKNARTLQEEQENDKLKKELALVNGIKEENYIVIDCRKSELEWIKDNVLNSQLTKLIDLSNINWNQCEEFALSNLVKKACEIKRDNPDMTTSEIGLIVGVEGQTIVKYLKKGSKIWDWVGYNPKEEKFKGSSKAGKTNGKPVEIFKDGISLGIFENNHELERQSEELFGVKFGNSAIASVCRGKYNLYKGYTFRYV